MTEIFFSVREVGNYRPIALTSHMGKVIERLVMQRMGVWLEEQRFFSQEQAGFRSGRSTVDQCLRMSQSISDGFQRSPMERTVLTLFDYSKAYDTVWRVGLLRKMANTNIPDRYIRWIKEWLVNRRAKVRYGEGEGRSRCMREGLPQGAVLSPIFFLIFINDLFGELDEGSLVSGYADDLAIAVQDHRKERAVERMQLEVDKVVRWSNRCWLKLSEGKCNICLYSTDPSESN